MRRGLLWFLAAVAVLLIVAFVAGEAVRRSDLPRRMVLDGATRATGLRFEAGSVRPGWWGETVVEGLVIRDPLSGHALVESPRAVVKHQSLPVLVATRSVGLERLELGEPVITLRQDRAGEWNLLRAIEAIRARQEQKERNGGGDADLPEITASAGTLHIRPNDGEAIITPFEFTGRSAGALAYDFRAELGDDAAAAGRVSTGGNWVHEASFEIGSERLLRPWLPDALATLRARGAWHGQVRNGAVEGRLRLDAAEIPQGSAQGEIAVEFSDGGFTFRPHGLEVRPLGGESVRVRGGEVRVKGGDVNVHSVRFAGYGAVAAVDGEWSAMREEGRGRASWSGGVVGVTHAGDLDVKVVAPRDGRVSLDAAARARGDAVGGEWEADLRTTLAGPSWKEWRADITAPTLVWRDREGPIDLSGLAARVVADWPTAEVLRLEIPGAARSLVEGTADLEARQWSLTLQAESWDVPRLARVANVEVEAAGRGPAVEVREFRARVGGILDIEGLGRYDPAADDPLWARATAAYRQPLGEGVRAPLPGDWDVEAEARGGAAPLDLALTGNAVGRDVKIGAELVPYVEVPWRGRAEGERIAISSRVFTLLGGEWRFATAFMPGQTELSLDVQTEAVPLDRISAVLDLPLTFAGSLDANVAVRMPELNPDLVEVEGTVAVADVTAPGTRFERGTGRLRSGDGMIRLTELDLRAGEAGLTGEMQFNMRDRRRLAVDLAAQGWPATIEGARLDLLVSGLARLEIDVIDLGAWGTLDAESEITIGGRHVGRIALDSTVHERTIDARRVTAELCGGAVDGYATVPLDDWLRTRGQFAWEAVDLRQIMECAGVDVALEGAVAGAVTISPTEDPRAVEPLEIDARLFSEGVAYGALQVGDASLLAHVGRSRGILRSGRFQVAEGTLETWARFSTHAGQPFLHIQGSVINFDLGQVVAAVNPEAEPVTGRVSGRGALGGYVFRPHRSFGEWQFELVDSDLARVPFIAQLYGLLNIGSTRNGSSGRGEVHARLEGDRLELRRLRYFNRGTDVVANLTIHDFWLGGESPISGAAAATLRPLREGWLPFAERLDELLAAFPGTAASVRVGGRVNDVQTVVVPFADIAGPIGRALGTTTRGD